MPGESDPDASILKVNSATRSQNKWVSFFLLKIYFRFQIYVWSLSAHHSIINMKWHGTFLQQNVGLQQFLCLMAVLSNRSRARHSHPWGAMNIQTKSCSNLANSWDILLWTKEMDGQSDIDILWSCFEGKYLQLQFAPHISHLLRPKMNLGPFFAALHLKIVILFSWRWEYFISNEMPS